MTSRLVQYHLLTNVSFLSRCKMLSSSHSLQAHVEHRSAVPVGCFPVPFILLCLPANTPDILTARRAGRPMRQEASPEGGRGHRGGRWKTDDGKHRRGVPLESDKKCKSLRSPTLSFPLTQTATEKKKNPQEERQSRKREREKKTRTRDKVYSFCSLFPSHHLPWRGKIAVSSWASELPCQWLSSRESACNVGDSGDLGSIPGSGRCAEGGNGNLLQYRCLENPID